MKSARSKYVSKRRLQKQPNNLIDFKKVIVAIILGVILIWMILVFSENKTDEKYYFSDSKYNGIRSKFINRESKKEKTSLEYPVTESYFINKTVADKIDEYDLDFKQSVKNSSFDGALTQDVSYQISHNDSEFMSLILSIKQDIQGAHPISLQFFWTFNKKENKIVTLSDLAQNSSQNIDGIVAEVRNNIEASLKSKNESTDLNEITAEDLTNFIILDKNTISWQLGRGQLLPSSFGEISVSIPVKTISKYIENDFAKKIFTVSGIPKIEPKKEVSKNKKCAKNCVALTFDDGPSGHTSKLLYILKEKNAKATFYVLGSQVSKRPDLLRRMKNEGHQIGNHTWSHVDLTKISPEQIEQEISKTDEVIKNVIGSSTDTVRPPYGSANSGVLTKFKELGKSSILWSVDTRDWLDRNSQIVCSRAVSLARSGSVILLHDIHATSVDAIPCIVDGLKKQGYELTTVDELLPEKVTGATYYSGN